jgi:hypothetical protein
VELDSLVGADRAAEHLAGAGVGAGPVGEPVAVADGFGGEQDAFGVQPVEDVAEALALAADEAARRNPQVDLAEGDATWPTFVARCSA